MKRKRSIWNFISRLGQSFEKNPSDVVLREIHCAELELAGRPKWRRHSSVLQQGKPVTWRAVIGGEEWNWDVSFLLLDAFLLFTEGGF